MRLDQLIVHRGLANSRTQSQKMISNGQVQVYLGGVWQVQQKPSAKFDESIQIQVELGEEQKFASRAGLKLEGALAHIGWDVASKTALDVGQSTGGFTDCLLQKGVSKVIGVDVGKDQLIARLKNDPRVRCIEQCNARELHIDMFDNGCPFDMAVMDVSFISQKLILPRLPALLKPGGKLVSLVKPQFEVGPSGIGKGGLVRDASLYQEVENTLKKFVVTVGFNLLDYFESPIQGGDGNREFFLYAERNSP